MPSEEIIAKLQAYEDAILGDSATVFAKTREALYAAINAEVARYTDAMNVLSLRIDELNRQLRQEGAACARWQDKALELKARAEKAEARLLELQDAHEEAARAWTEGELEAKARKSGGTKGD
jgi:chromosome segregation ATPase